jgi:hypothetical protein
MAGLGLNASGHHQYQFFSEGFTSRLRTVRVIKAMYRANTGTELPALNLDTGRLTRDNFVHEVRTNHNRW